MGFFSSIGSISDITKKERTLEELRREQGFDQFDAYMQGLQNYDPAAKLKNAEEQAASPAKKQPSRKATTLR